MAIITKMVNGYGPYKYRVTYEDGEHHWEYIEPVGSSESESKQEITQADKENEVTEDLVIENVNTYPNGDPQLAVDDVAHELGIDPDNITSIKSVKGEGQEEFDWVNRDSITNGQYKVYVDSELAERVRVRKDGSNAKLTRHDSRRSLTEGLPRTSWCDSGFSTDYDEMVGEQV